MLSILEVVESEQGITDLTKLTILDVVNDPEWFGKWFAAPSWDGWKAFLAALFGLPMTPAQLRLYREFTGRTVAPETQAREAWMVVPVAAASCRGGSHTASSWAMRC
jgi:hypothetical protein